VLLRYNNYYFHHTIISRHSIPLKSIELVLRSVPEVQGITKLGMSHYKARIKTKWIDTAPTVRELLWNKERLLPRLIFLQLRQKVSLSLSHTYSRKKQDQYSTEFQISIFTPGSKQTFRFQLTKLLHHSICREHFSTSSSHINHTPTNISLA